MSDIRKNDSKKSPSLFKEILVTRWPFRIFILLASLGSAAFGLLGPFFQKEFIDYLTKTPSKFHFVQVNNILWFIFAAFLCVVISLAFSQLANFLSNREAIFMQKRFARRLYDKTLSLRIDTMAGRPVGEITALYATDVQGATVFLEQTLPAGASTLFPLILAPFAISALFDIPMWSITFTIIGITLLNSALAYRQSRFFFKFKKLAADRTALVSEWIQNIRTIRILSWMRYFEKNIFAKREVETENRVAMVTNGQTMNAIATSITFILNALALYTLINSSGHVFTSGELLALLWIVGIFLTKPFRQMPWFFTFAFDSWTSLRRLEDYLATENNSTQTSREVSLSSTPAADYAISVKGLNLIIGKRHILRDIDLAIKPSEFVAIVGEVGAGKSMLLLSLLRETGASFKEYKISNKDYLQAPYDEIRENFAYVPQEGFIMNATLRENVAFLYDIDPEKDSLVEESLRLAQFDLSSERVEDGLNTDIGERGVNLSGGQRQRIGLARVHYLNAPIMLLDDCLSAVDVDTEQKLFDGLLLGEWKNRTRVLVTHRLSVLHRVDRIIFMDEGRVIDSGSFEEIYARNEKFRSYTMTVASESAKQSEVTHV